MLSRDRIAFFVGFLGVVEAGGVVAPMSRLWPEAQQAQALDLVQPAATLRWRKEGFEIEATGGGNPVAASAAWESDAPFYIGFSSGSTGAPKAIVRSHRAWLNSFIAMTEEFDVQPPGSVIVPGDPVFSFSLIAGLHALFTGCSVVLQDRVDVAALLGVAEEHGGTLCLLPSVLSEVVRVAKRRGVVAPNLERIVCAGEKLRGETRVSAREVFPNANIFEYYGASELGFVTVLDDAAFAVRPGSVGRAFMGTRIAILDEQGRDLPPGEAGLLCARTEYGCMGYWDGRSVRSRPDHFGWNSVGDLAVRDDDGYVSLVGRRDNMIVLRGENIYPEAVETVLEAAPGVAAAVAVPQPVESPSHLVALVVADEPSPELRRGVLDYSREHLAGLKLPRRVVLVDSLPRTAAGKIDRGRAAELAARLTE